MENVVQDLSPRGNVDQHMDPAQAQLERETGERRRGRDILVAVDHSPTSKHAFDWTIAHLCRLADTLHLLHVLSKSEGDCSDNETTSTLMEQLTAEAYEVAMVKTEVHILGGDIAKKIVEVATNINPVAVVMGTHCQGIIKSVLQGSVSEYCSHHCPCPVVLVPPKESGDHSVL